MIDITTDGPPKLVARTSWIMQWATSNEPLHVRFFKGWALGLALGVFISSLFLCYVPCFHYEYSRTDDGAWDIELVGTDWRLRVYPFGVYVCWLRGWLRRRLRLFFMGSEERTIRDEEAGDGDGDFELRDRGRRGRGRRRREQDEEDALPEPTIPQFTGSYMFSAAGPSDPEAQRNYGNPERQQRVRDEFRMERENIQRRVAEQRRSEIQQADAATLAQNEHGAVTTPQQDVAIQQHVPAPESVQNHQVTGPQTAPATRPALGPYQRHNPLDPMHPINMTNDDIERERLQKERRANAWYRSMWSFLG